MIQKNLESTIRFWKQKSADYAKAFTRYMTISRLIALFVFVLKYYFYKLTKPGRTFTIDGQKYRYFYSLYNFTFLGERTVEIPIIWKAVVNTQKKKRILEIGNVLSHYFPIKHDVIDKYEKAQGVINQDIVDYSPSKPYHLIISISTIEHVGRDEIPKNEQKVILALKKIRSLLTRNGQAIITLPVGYNSYLDKYLKKTSKKMFSKEYFLKRISQDNKWKEVTKDEAFKAKFNSPYSFANAIIIGYINK